MFRTRLTLFCSLLALAACAQDEGGIAGADSDATDDTSVDTAPEVDTDFEADTLDAGAVDTAVDTSDTGSNDTAVDDTSDTTEEVTDTEVPPDTTPQPPRSCLSWLECDSGQGCAEGLCGGCTSGADCPDLLGCTADATCGSCATDSECRSGEGCIDGVCLATTISEVRITVDPADYRQVLAEIHDHGSVNDATRFELARKVFAHTAQYDGAIANFLTGLPEPDTATADQQANTIAGQNPATASPLPQVYSLQVVQRQGMRYGENPHQQAAVYVNAGAASGLAAGEQLQGKEM
jgi:hypothetical protein